MGYPGVGVLGIKGKLVNNDILLFFITPPLHCSRILRLRERPLRPGVARAQILYSLAHPGDTATLCGACRGQPDPPDNIDRPSPTSLE